MYDTFPSEFPSVQSMKMAKSQQRSWTTPCDRTAWLLCFGKWLLWLETGQAFCIFTSLCFLTSNFKYLSESTGLWHTFWHRSLGGAVRKYSTHRCSAKATTKTWGLDKWWEAPSFPNTIRCSSSTGSLPIWSFRSTSRTFHDHPFLEMLSISWSELNLQENLWGSFPIWVKHNFVPTAVQELILNCVIFNRKVSVMKISKFGVVSFFQGISWGSLTWCVARSDHLN